MEKKDKYEKELLEVIKSKKIAFFDHCFGFTSFSRTTAYDYKLNDSDAIKVAIAKNRATAKNYMLNKWIASDNATLQISAMRLLSDSEEHQKLNQSYIDHTSKGEKITKIEREIVKPEN
ncbi:MAG TPA: hypothetical protein VLB84_20005 [Bacteroidia bacterium]|nr:hypothetical protein [Bacteroidia bacterium]